MSYYVELDSHIRDNVKVVLDSGAWAEFETSTMLFFICKTRTLSRLYSLT